MKRVPYRYLETEDGALQRSKYKTAPGETFAVFLDDQKRIIDACFYLCDERGLPHRWEERFVRPLYAREDLRQHLPGEKR